LQINSLTYLGKEDQNPWRSQLNRKKCKNRSRNKGKKKVQAPNTKSDLLTATQQNMEAQQKRFEQSFQISCERVIGVLSRVHPVDALSALNISDLWQPNRASQVKHLLAFSLLVSMPVDRFALTRITTYEEFAEFCRVIIESMPDFPMLEDYVPEADWGAVKVLIGQEPVAILHGGPVQRISDYIEAFRIGHKNGSQAIADLEISIRLQSQLLQQVPFNGNDQPDESSPGHTEIPPANFWEVTLPALSNLLSVNQLHDRYITQFGKPATWSSDVNSFSEAVMTGAALPWQAVRIDGTTYAMCLRNATTVVIDAWAAETYAASPWVATQLGSYLAKRIKTRSCLTGPLVMRSCRERVPLPIAAVLISAPRFYLLVPVTIDQLEVAKKAVISMHRVMRDLDYWFQVIGTSDRFQLRNSQSSTHQPTSMKIILVISTVTTGHLKVRKTNTKAQLMSLVDACTIFDSIESVDELTRFWNYVDDLGQYGGSPLSDLGDLFGSFRDAHAQIIEGALMPNFLSLDPHWGASWRYNQLKKFWSQAPLIFPDEDNFWEVNETMSDSSLSSVIAKNTPKIAWSSVIGATTLYFILDADDVGLESQDGSLLELFLHCAADSIAERASIIEPFLQLPMRRINLNCFSEDHLLASGKNEQVQQALVMPLITEWEELASMDPHSYQARVIVNLAKLAQELEIAEDATFEAACALVVIEYLFEVLDCPMPSKLREALINTADRSPRFTVSHMQRQVDVPDFTQPQAPTSEDYKVARRDLAILLKGQDIEPGMYDLEVAKALINRGREAYRDEVHKRIREMDRESLLWYCVNQYDSFTASYGRDETRIKQSLGHEVDYDREHAMFESHKKFIRESKNYRYLLECSVVLTSAQASPARAEAVLSILAMVDWLLVLYSASDVLHNDIDVVGLRIDDQHVPEVFFSEKRMHQEDVFGRELAALRLGVNVVEEDKVSTAMSTESYFSLLDKAFDKDLQFTYTHMLQVFSTLTFWVSVGGDQELACEYASEKQSIAERAVATYPELPFNAALAVIEFLILKSDHAWHLIGKDHVPDDVPVWEHFKRGSRHAIRPLIELADDRVLWGAAVVERASRIWRGAISDGYLPADYPWPNIKKAVRQLKKELEGDLEVRAHDICDRVMPYAIKGIDFKSRFPNQKFPEVGDFDVLAYRPEKNLWLTVECKYNQPAFCLKDARRLRDTIFGRGSKKGQLQKIEQRRDFFIQNIDTLRSLLGWPTPEEEPFSVSELYVSKDMHFWLRFPPYEVPTHFVQIDTLDAWLRSNVL
jgi:hypothetical protein